MLLHTSMSDIHSFEVDQFSGDRSVGQLPQVPVAHIQHHIAGLGTNTVDTEDVGGSDRHGFIQGNGLVELCLEPRPPGLEFGG